MTAHFPPTVLRPPHHSLWGLSPPQLPPLTPRVKGTLSASQTQAFLRAGSVLTEHATPGGKDGGPCFLFWSLFSPQLSCDATHGIPRPVRSSTQPSLVLSGYPWLPEQPEGGLAASGATSPRKPHRANDCWGPREARPARSRSCRRTRRVHKLRV